MTRHQLASISALAVALAFLCWIVLSSTEEESLTLAQPTRTAAPDMSAMSANSKRITPLRSSRTAPRARAEPSSTNPPRPRRAEAALTKILLKKAPQRTTPKRATTDEVELLRLASGLVAAKDFKIEGGRAYTATEMQLAALLVKKVQGGLMVQPAMERLWLQANPGVRHLLFDLAFRDFGAGGEWTPKVATEFLLSAIQFLAWEDDPKAKHAIFVTLNGHLRYHVIAQPKVGGQVVRKYLDEMEKRWEELAPTTDLPKAKFLHMLGKALRL